MDFWQPPREFDGFQISGPLAAGAMGRVYLAHEALLDRSVALKFIAQDEPDRDARARFIQEARAVASLQHPNVVAIYRVGEVELRPYIAYEYVDGRSLDQATRPISWTRALEVGLAVSRGLAFAHRRGVLHRDVKPANIILANDGPIKLVDFGLAKFVARGRAHESGGEPDALLQHGDPATSALGTPSGRLVGTPQYIAPELWLGADSSSRSDVYAVGLVLYELLSGSFPFGALSGPDLMESVTRVPLPPVATLCHDVPRSFAQVVDRAVAHEPESRFGDAAELLEALELIDGVLRAFRQVTENQGGQDDVSLVSASLDRLHAGASEVMTAFYDRLFRTAPEIRRLFPSSMLSQKLMLAAALRLAVENLRNPGRLVPVLEDLGTRHASYGAQREHFIVFCDTLIETVRQFDDAWDEPTQRAWQHALAAITGAMQHVPNSTTPEVAVGQV